MVYELEHSILGLFYEIIQLDIRHTLLQNMFAQICNYNMKNRKTSEMKPYFQISVYKIYRHQDFVMIITLISIETMSVLQRNFTSNID